MIGALAGGAVLSLGFGALCLFWFLGSWEPGLPGLFDYRSATVGDAVLLPVALSILATACASWPRARAEVGWAAGAAALGLALGIAVIRVWRGDDTPYLNWTLPRPHHFTSAGWYHAIFLILTLGAVSALLMTTARRARRAVALASDPDVSAWHPWLSCLIGCGGAFAGLLTLDNNRAIDSASGRTTAIAVGAALLSGTGLIGLAFGRTTLVLGSAIGRGTLLAAGITALSAYGIPARPVIQLATAGSAVLVGIALGGHLPTRTIDVLDALIKATLLAGSTGIAVHMVTRNAAASVVPLAIGAIASLALSGVHRLSLRRVVLTAFATFYPFAVLALAAWTDRASPSTGEASAAIGAASGFLDVLVFQLVRDRFGDLIIFEKHAPRRWRPGAEPSERPAAVGFRIWVQMLGFAIPALCTLFVLFGVSAKTVGLDRYAHNRTEHLRLLGIAAGAAVALASLAAAAAWRWRRTPGRCELHARVNLSALAALIVAVATGGWLVVLISMLDAPFRHTTVAALAATAVAALTLEDLWRSPVHLHLARLGFGGWCLSILGAATSGTATFWLLAKGLRRTSLPASTGATIVAALIALGGAALLCTAIGALLAAGLRSPPLTPQHPAENVLLGQAMYVLLTLIAAVVPFYIVGRVDAAPTLKNAGLLVLGNLSVLPAVVFAFIWVLGNNADHAAREASAEPPQGLSECAPESLTHENDLRISRLHAHINWQNGAAIVAFVAGLGWAAQIFWR